MLRRLRVSVAALSLLCGFSAAPYTHAHHQIDSVSDDQHPHGETLVHTHATPHSHDHQHQGEPHEDESPESGDRIWSIDSFVCQQAAPDQAPTPVLVAFGEPAAPLTLVRLGTARPQPRAHGPPAVSNSALRAPPAFLPAFS